jgi:hypothetical protein
MSGARVVDYSIVDQAMRAPKGSPVIKESERVTAASPLLRCESERM